MQWLFPALAFFALSAPAGAAENLDLTPTAYTALPGWQTSDSLKSEALSAFVSSCDKILAMPESAPLGPYAGSAQHWQPLCFKARGTLKRVEESKLPAEQDDMARRFFETGFMPYQVKAGGKVEGLFTGYYIPQIKASHKRTAKFQYPLYRVPADLKPEKPYLTRAQIDGGALKGKGLEIAYTDDPVKLFFLQVQGSGSLAFTDGTAGFVSFAARNNQPYTAIGKVLVEQGALAKEKVTAPAIMEWLHAHPDKAQGVMEKNASYVFFKEQPGQHAIGAEGVALSPLASLAVDKDFIALGSPLWLDTTLPQKNKKDKPFRSLVIAQDTGTAIQGAVRGDVFCGQGERAEWLAGHMKQPGRYFLLLPRTLKVAHGKE
jgi:membrane-bound lytic murein transglycosylase A